MDPFLDVYTLSEHGYEDYIGFNASYTINRVKFLQIHPAQDVVLVVKMQKVGLLHVYKLLSIK